MNLLAISGSIRKHSYNSALLNAMKARSPAGVTVSLFNVLERIPAFNPDIGASTTPEIVDNFLSAVRESDGLIISTPEYAHGIPGALKNALDWAVSSDAIVLKPTLVTSVSTSGLGGIRSLSPLVSVLSAMNAHVVIQGSIIVPHAQNKFDHNYDLTDDITIKSIEVAFMAMRQAIINAL